MSELTPRRLLPLLPGAQHLKFQCNGCGTCCRALRVAVTRQDVRRLAHGLGRPAESLVDWLPADAVDMTGEPGSFVELGSGRRLMVLAQEGGACRLLDPSGRCSAYELRPRDCRLYPFDLLRDETGEVTGVARLDPDGCGDEAGEPSDLAALAASDQTRWDELRTYQADVERWNRLARHRRRFRHRVGDAPEFLRWLGIDDAARLDDA